MSRNRCGCPCGRTVLQHNNSNNNSDNENKCQCGFSDSNVFPVNFMYGQSYVPIQTMSETFNPEVGLKMGSIFPELISPYEPGQSMDEIAYLRRMTQNMGRCPNQAN